MGFGAQLRLFLDLISMVYFHHAPVFNIRMKNEERGCFLSHCRYSFHSDTPGAMVLALPVCCVNRQTLLLEPSQGSWAESLTLLFSELSSLYPQGFSDNTIYFLLIRAKVLWPLYPGSDSGTEFNWLHWKHVSACESPLFLLEGREVF